MAPAPIHKAADIDTAPPFQNVKAAVRLFGEKGAIKSLSERHGASETETCKLEEELAKVRAQLADVQKDRDNALVEIEDLKKRLESNQALVSPSVDCVVKEDDDRPALLAELQALKREVSVLEQKLCVALQEKENAVRQAEEAHSSAEVNAKRAEELSNEISGTKESLLLVKMACIEANNEREALLAARNAISIERAHIHSTKLFVDDSLIDSNKLEIGLNCTSRVEEISEGELRVVRQNLIAARGALTNIDKLMAGCGSGVIDASISEELAAAKAELSKALDNDTLIESALKELQENLKEVKQELDATKSELGEVRNREAHAITVLKSEVEKTKEELRAAVSCNKAFVGLSQKLQNFAVFEEKEENMQVEDALTVKAKAELHAMLKEEAEAVRHQAELRQKASQLAQQHTTEAAHKASEDSLPVLLKNENSNSFSGLRGDSVAVESWMRYSYKEELKKKKIKLPLPSFSALLSRSKRGNRKGMVQEA